MCVYLPVSRDVCLCIARSFYICMAVYLRDCMFMFASVKKRKDCIYCCVSQHVQSCLHNENTLRHQSAQCMVDTWQLKASGKQCFVWISYYSLRNEHNVLQINYASMSECVTVSAAQPEFVSQGPLFMVYAAGDGEKGASFMSLIPKWNMRYFVTPVYSGKYYLWTFTLI